MFLLLQLCRMKSEKLFKILKHLVLFVNLMRNWKFHVRQQLLTFFFHPFCMKSVTQTREIGQNIFFFLPSTLRKKFLAIFSQEEKFFWYWIIICHFSGRFQLFFSGKRQKLKKINQSWFWEDLRLLSCKKL